MEKFPEMAHNHPQRGLCSWELPSKLVAARSRDGRSLEYSGERQVISEAWSMSKYRSSLRISLFTNATSLDQFRNLQNHLRPHQTSSHSNSLHSTLLLLYSPTYSRNKRYLFTLNLPSAQKIQLHNLQPSTTTISLNSSGISPKSSRPTSH